MCIRASAAISWGKLQAQSGSACATVSVRGLMRAKVPAYLQVMPLPAGVQAALARADKHVLPPEKTLLQQQAAPGLHRGSFMVRH